MLVLDQPHPPTHGNGRFFVDRGNWTQLDPLRAGGNKNYPFGERDRNTPYRQFKMVGLYLGPASIELSFDLDEVDTASLQSALDFLDTISSDRRRISLEFCKQGWFRESHGDVKSSLERIEQIMIYRDLPLASHTVVGRLDWASLDAAPPLLRACRSIWREKPGFAALTQAGLGDRLVLMATDDNGQPAFSEIGPDSAISHYFGSAWRRQALGVPVGASLPDRKYDRDTARGVLDVIESGEPRYDRILASIARPGQDREWAAYHRLQLPIDNQVVSVIQLVPPQELGIPFLQPL